MGVRIRQLKNGKWGVYVTYQGQRKCKVFADYSRAQAFAKKVDTALELYGLDAFLMFQRARPKPSRIPTLATYSQKWLKEKRKTLRIGSWHDYEMHCRLNIIPILGEYRLDEIDYSRLKDFVIQVQDRGKAANTIRKMLAVLRAMLNEAIQEKLITTNPVMGLERHYQKARRERKKNPFTLDELYAIEDIIAEKYPEHLCFTVFLSRTGCRIGEARALKWTDIDWRKRQVYIERNFPTHSRSLSPTKTPSGERWVDLSPDLLEALRRHKRRQQEYWFSRGREMPDWVFTTSTGRPFWYSTFLNRVWVPTMKKSGIKYRPPHELRHTFASELLAQGEDAGYVAAQLGHSSVAVTNREYRHWIPGRKRIGVEGMDRPRFGRKTEEKPG